MLKACHSLVLAFLLKNQKEKQSKIQSKLEEGLEKLKELFDLGHDLRVLYIPKKSKLKGCLKGRGIIVHDSENPIHVLIHEFIEYLLAQYYLAPMLMAKDSIMVEHSFHSKEQIIEALVKVVRKAIS
jgi:hypothetical protein